MVNDNNEIYLRQFKANVKKHIDDIANKYINAQTVDQLSCSFQVKPYINLYVQNVLIR